MTGTLGILDRLVAFDTVSDRSNLALVEYVEQLLRDHGGAVSRLADATGRKSGLFAEIGPPGDGILLSGHTDVVPVEGQDWTRPPFRLTREGGRVYGRGTTDMKGFVASALSLATRAARAPLREPLKIVLSYDEELGCLGIAEMRDRLAPLLGRPRACIVGEPTGMQVATGHKGKLALGAVCHGQAGHSALAPHFVSALHMAADFVTELRALQDDLARSGARDPAYAVPYSTVHVGRLAAGVALNMVPDRAELALEIRHLAAEEPARLVTRIEAAAEGVAARCRGRFEAARIAVARQNGYPGLEVAADHPVVALAQSLTGVGGTTRVAFGTEAGVFDALGIPTVVCGPGDMAGQGHKPDEFVALDELDRCDRMMDRILETLCA